MLSLGQGEKNLVVRPECGFPSPACEKLGFLHCFEIKPGFGRIGGVKIIGIVIIEQQRGG